MDQNMPLSDLPGLISSDSGIVKVSSVILECECESACVCE